MWASFLSVGRVPVEGRGMESPYLAHAGAGGSCHSPCGLTGSPGSGTPARRRRTPAPQPREARIRAATRKAGKALTRGV